MRVTIGASLVPATRATLAVVATLAAFHCVRPAAASSVLTLRLFKKSPTVLKTMAVGGVSRDDGFTDFSLDDVAVKQAALRSARRCVVACDASKIGKVGFARIGGLGVAATLVTDASLADADRAWLTEAGLDLVIA